MATTFRPTDPLYLSQWHFGLIGRLGATTASNSEGIERIWAEYQGHSVHVGLWDTGLQSSHWDLQANVDLSRRVTIDGTLNDGEPLTGTSGHGTAAAGLIAAAANGLGGVGVAPGASLTAVRVFGGADDINSAWSRYLQTLDSLGNFDVTSHSYGSTPDFQAHDDIARFAAAAANGRGGLGTLNVKAAGNSNIDGNGEALSASRFTVTVGALTASGQVTSYSSYGAHLLISAPAASVTTDLLGTGSGYDGLENGDYTNRFNGTSAATPVVSGVISLMLDANPLLGWRDVQNILAYSAAGTGSLYTGYTADENFAWKWNGAGNWNGGALHYSEDYGYGLVNAFQAVRMAEAWRYFSPTPATSANERIASTGSLSTNNLAIVDQATTVYSFNVSDNVDLEHVDLTLSFTHSYFRDLRLRLVSPGGVAMSLYDGTSGSGSTSSGLFTYSFGVEGFRGVESAGTWRVELQDAAALDSGTLYSVGFSGTGALASNDDIYHYTDEIFTLLGQSGQAFRQSLSDSNGGQDWIDASAMVRDLNLDLNSGASSSAGGTAFLSIASDTRIEKAIGGDGNDRLVGNAYDNVLIGMRGDDWLVGGDGNDTAVFRGLRALYSIASAGGLTTVIGADGTDVLSGMELLRFDDVTLADPGAPADTTAPTLMGLAPAAGSVDVALASDLVLTFSEAVQAGSGDVVIRNDSGEEVRRIAITDTSQVSISGSVVTINPSQDLPGGSALSVSVAAGAIVDRAGNGFAGITDPSVFRFSTLDPVTTITGTGGADSLTGSAGTDRLYGLAGNDTLNGAAGNDLLDGGDGSDLASYAGLSAAVRVSLAIGGAQDTGGSGIETLVSIENLLGGSGNDTLSGDGGANRIDGGAGDDWIEGGAGNDTLIGNGNGGGGDTVSYAGAAAAVTVSLASTSAQTTGGAGTDTLSGFENLIGSAYDDTLTGGSGGNGILGGAGADRIRGNGGRDTLTGGGGNDLFLYGSAAEAGLGATGRDRITDLEAGDRIDLSAIDANSKSGGNQAFSFIGTAAFTAAGQLRYDVIGELLVLQANTSGTSGAEFELELAGLASLGAGSIIL